MSLKMLKSPSKSKKGPWVPPPGRSRKVDKSLPKVAQQDPESTSLSILPKIPHDSEEEDLDLISHCSSSSANGKSEDLNIYLSNIKQEQRVLNLYFMSLRPISQFLNRYFINSNIQDDTLKKLLLKIEEQLNNLLRSFEDLEYLITLFQNTIPENSNSEEFLKIVMFKENLLLKLLGCYTDILTVFQVAVEEHGICDVTKQEKESDSLKKQLQSYDKKLYTQTATIKDLERRLSILQGKYSSIESYNTTLEETKAELQKLLHYKDVQIKNLNAEVNQFSPNQNNEKLIEIIEEIKIKAQAEKTALKKALKVQKMHTEQKTQIVQKLEQDISEKVKMLFELAAQRDKLKIQLTVANNQVVESKYQVEEIKSQKLKLQNEFSESEMTLRHKLSEEIDGLKNKLDATTADKTKCEQTIKKLEEDLHTTTNELKTLESSNVNTSPLHVDKNNKDIQTCEEVKNLISLLQDTKGYLQSMKIPDVAAKGDSIQIGMAPKAESILAIVQDIKEQLVELKRPSVKEDYIDKSYSMAHAKQLEELKYMHKMLNDENAALKEEIETMKSSISNTEQVPMHEKYPSVDTKEIFSTKNLQMELMLKNEEIFRAKQRESKLEYQLEEVKDKLQKKEMENCRLFSLEESLKTKEEELRSTKMELSLLERKKLEESERLLHRTKELQEALDEKSANYESLQRYVDMLKSSLYNVFGDS